MRYFLDAQVSLYEVSKSIGTHNVDNAIEMLNKDAEFVKSFVEKLKELEQMIKGQEE